MLLPLIYTCLDKEPADDAHSAFISSCLIDVALLCHYSAPSSFCPGFCRRFQLLLQSCFLDGHHVHSMVVHHIDEKVHSPTHSCHVHGADPHFLFSPPPHELLLSGPVTLSFFFTLNSDFSPPRKPFVCRFNSSSRSSPSPFLSILTVRLLSSLSCPGRRPLHVAFHPSSILAPSSPQAFRLQVDVLLTFSSSLLNVFCVHLLSYLL